MKERDYLKNQIDDLAKVLRRLLIDFLDLKQMGKWEEGMDMVKRKLTKELGLGPDALAGIPADRFMETLTGEKSLNNYHLEILSDLLYETAELTQEEDKAKLLYEKALILFEHLMATDTTYSLDRQFKIEKIKALL